MVSKLIDYYVNPNHIIMIVFLFFLISIMKGTTEDFDNKQTKKMVGSYLSGNIVNLDHFYLSIFNSGKKSIPILMEFIDKDEKGYRGHISSLDSRLPTFIRLENYIGLKSAYLIEFILSKENFNDFELSEQELLWKDKYNIFYFKIILKVINEQNQTRPLVLEEMIELKSIYKEWWRKNRNKSIEELRKDWKNNIRPLTGSPYSWF